jgi:hypothetical protein
MGLRAVALAIVVLCSVAHADDDKPWAKDVSPESQQQALTLFQEGNAFFIKDEWPKALDKYTAALVHWDHPNIRYNAAVCLIKLDRSVEAYEHMQAALRFGEAPLGPELFKQGQTYLQMLAKTTAYIEVICKEPAGVQVTIDGHRLDRCPETKLVLPGKHQIVTEKPGYKTERREVVAPPGGKETVIIVMQPEAPSRKLVRRWDRWKPWAVVAGGAAVGLAGVPLWFATRSRFDDYDAKVADYCRQRPGGGCVDADLAMFDDDLSSAKTLRTVTYSTLAVGAAGVAVGVVLVFMNQPSYEPVVVSPMAGADHAGVSISGAW